MIRLALDGTPLLGPRTGIGEVVAGLTTGLSTRTDLDVTAYALTWRGRHQLHAVVPPGVRAATARIPARVARQTWLRAEYPRIERWTGPVDVVHATNYVAPPTRAPSIVSVYDLGFVRFPELCTADVLQYPTLLKRAIARGAWIHATSDAVAGELTERFPVPAERVVRVYPGVPRTHGGDAAAGRRAAGVDHYVLFIGTIEPRKNLPVLVRAFDAAADDDPDLALVVAGAPGWGVDEFAGALAQAHHGARVHQLGYVSDVQRRDLLAGAAALAYPSRYEGFGFPPLEAMAADVPVVAARTGAIPEVVGDAALLVDPDDVDALAAALLTVVHDADRRRDLVARGRAQLARFTWDRMADELAQLYHRRAGA
jgi:glycosyltransferase involved in cell wall biosynthesis